MIPCDDLSPVGLLVLHSPPDEDSSLLVPIVGLSSSRGLGPSRCGSTSQFHWRTCGRLTGDGGNLTQTLSG